MMGIKLNTTGMTFICNNCGVICTGSYTHLQKRKDRQIIILIFCNELDECVDKCLELMDQGYELVNVEIK